jgi:hypothetical protein
MMATLTPCYDETVSRESLAVQLIFILADHNTYQIRSKFALVTAICAA